MKKVKGLLLVAFLVSFCWITTDVKASLKPLSNLENFQWANQAITPAENTFIMHSGARTKVTPLNGDATTNRLSVDQKINESQALVENVGFYQGKSVNLLVTLKRNKSNLKGGSLSFTKDYFLGIDIAGEVMVTYQFVDANQNPLTIKTAFNYFGLNSNKYIGYQDYNSVISAVYANNPTNIRYESENQWMYLKNTTVGIPWRDPRQSFEVVTKPISQVTFAVHNNDSTPSSLVYLTEFLARPESAPAYAESSDFNQANNGVYLAAQQTVPSTNSFTSEVSFNLEHVYNSEQYIPERIKVTNFDGKDVTQYFDWRIENQKVYIKTRPAATRAITDTTLHYKVYLKWLEAKKTVDPTRVVNGKLGLPFDVSTSVNGQAVGKSNAVSTVDYVGRVNVVFLADNGFEVLRAREVKSGILTTKFDVTDIYPEIADYIPIKNDAVQDTGTFLPGNKTIIHQYRKGEKLSFKLKNLGDTLYISRFSNQSKLTVSFTHEDGAKIRLVGNCAGEKRILKEYSNAAHQVDDEIICQFPKSWINKKVDFYLEDDQHQMSNKETRIIKQERGPELSLPSKIDFGSHEIPLEITVCSLTRAEWVRVKDRSELDHYPWILKVREEHPLTNQNDQKLISRLYFKGNVINGENQTIGQDTGNLNLDLSQYLQLVLEPMDQIGSYHGELRWTLEDAPN
ncbi:hypothetical protein [Pediococcus pentosaceus]|uniref:hypothetical protein n=1 Tax=Pediococcus pentosaceus TaxID=1255 RepID=UPI0010531091|nr:hypothetical protein [Pediococcus pentosaceus]KAF0524289.1 hypothetical protein GBP32_01680 [Pediococcus pentosaceus]